MTSRPTGTVQSIWRHPLKGFTPEALTQVVLTAGAHFPFDRLYAVEDGPSGFNPARPAHISKQKFTVLAKIPAIARIRTRFDEAGGLLDARCEGHAPIQVNLAEQEGRDALARWLTAVLGDEVTGPLRVLPAPDKYRFMDDAGGFVSLVNLNSVRELEHRIGRPVDPRRFRANLYVDGWPAWIENDPSRRSVKLGSAVCEVFKPIVRCAATHVDPDAGERDLDLVPALYDHFGHTCCGVYVKVTGGGRVMIGEAAAI